MGDSWRSEERRTRGASDGVRNASAPPGHIVALIELSRENRGEGRGGGTQGKKAIALRTDLRVALLRSDPGLGHQEGETADLWRCLTCFRGDAGAPRAPGDGASPSGAGGGIEAHLFVLLNLALLKHGEDVGGAAISAPLPPLGLLRCLERKRETG